MLRGKALEDSEEKQQQSHKTHIAWLRILPRPQLCVGQPDKLDQLDELRCIQSTHREPEA
jgi:hypothetical protein